MPSERKLLLSAAALITMLLPTGASAQPACEAPKATLLVAGLQGTSGRTRWARWCAIRHRRRDRQESTGRSENR